MVTKTREKKVKDPLKPTKKTLTAHEAELWELKMEVAEELGLLDKVKTAGWAELTPGESGRIGGVMTRKMKERGLIE